MKKFYPNHKDLLRKFFSLLLTSVLLSIPALAQDTTPPQVADYSPSPGYTKASLYPVVRVTFDEEIAIGTGNVVIYTYDDDVAFQVIDVANMPSYYTLSGNEISFWRDDNFEMDTKYYVTICSTCITDLSANPFAGISGKDTWSFTTGDSSPPEVISVIPDYESTEVAVDANIEVTFDEDIILSHESPEGYDPSIISIHYYDDDEVFEEIATNSGRMSVSGNVLTIDPVNDLPYEAHLYVLIPNDGDGTIYDLNDNIMDPFSWDFTTESDQPQILSFTPTIEITPTNVSLELTYDRNMIISESSVPSLRIYNSNDTQVAFFNKNSANLILDGSTVTFNVPTVLASDEDYYIVLNEGLFVDANDPANLGAGITNTTTWTFSTRPNDGNGPNIVSFSPENGATKVKRLGSEVDFEITFDEEVFLGTTSGSVLLYRETGETDQLYYNIGAFASISEDNLTVTFNIPGGYIMQENSEYYITLNDNNNVIYDADGNNVTPIMDENIWRFTTYGPVEVLSTSPADDAINVSTDGVVSFTTNNDITVATGAQLYLRYYSNNANAAVIASNSEAVTLNGNQVTIEFGELAESTDYYVYIPNSALRDEFNQTFTIAGKDTWNFTTTEPVVDIPDENFKDYLVNNTNINTNGDEEIQVSEAATFTGSIDVYSRDISDLTGIEAFPLLTSLNCLDNNLTSIDVSQNIALEYLNVGFNSLTSLNVSNNTNLFYLGAYVNSISSLDVSQNTELIGLEVYGNMLTSIDVSQNEDLEGLEVQENQLTSLNLGSLAFLGELYCNDNLLTSLDVSQNTGLYEIYCHDNLLEELNVANGVNSEGYVDATNNSGLICIQVDDETESNLDFWDIDEGASFSEDCNVPEDNEAPVVETFAYRFETDVPVNAGELTVTFNESVVTTSSLNINMWDYSNNLIVQYLGENPEGLSIDGEVVTFAVPQLTYGESYYIQINGGSFEDLAGNSYAGIVGAQHWYFTAELEEEPVVQINDASFKTFLLNNEQINANADEEIQVSEAENYAGNITYSNQGLSDPTGLEAFINTVWIDLSLNDLTSIDLSANVDAAQVNLIGNDLGSLVLPDRTTFNNILLNGNQLTSLTLPEGITANTLQIYQNPIVSFEAVNGSFDVINGASMSTMTGANLAGTDVRVLNLSGSQISTLNLTSASSLESIDVSGCGNLTMLDLGANTSLESVTTALSAVQSLDLSNHPDITTLMARNGQLTELNIQNGTNTSISTFQIQNNSNLECVQVDNVEYSDTNWTSKDAGTNYSTDCDAQPQDQTITFETIGDKTYGDAPFTLEATASSQLEVTFSIVSGPVLLNNGNEITITGAGTAVIAANQAGDFYFNAASEERQTFEIAKAEQVITVEPVSTKLTTDGSFDVEASVDSELTLSYGVSGPATNSGATITLTGETGTVTVTVSQTGNANYEAASESISFNVTDPAKTDQAITFVEISDKTYGDAPFTLEASASSELEVTFRIVSGPVSLSNGNEITITGAGIAIIAANQAGDEDFNPASEERQTFIIAKADQVITIEPIGDKLTTDGSFDVVASVDSELALSYTVSGPATNNGPAITLSGEAGTVTVTVSQAGNENYLEAAESVSFDVAEETTLAAGDMMKVKFYPNPVINYLNIESEDEFEVRLMNMEGKVMRYLKARDARLHVTDLPGGIYLLELTNNGNILRKKIMKIN